MSQTLHEIVGAPFQVTPGGDIRTVRDDKFVASIFGIGATQKRARSLIFAASPDLLVASTALLDEIDAAGTEPLNSPRLNALRAAIAKAEGRAS